MILDVGIFFIEKGWRGGGGGLYHSFQAGWQVEGMK